MISTGISWVENDEIQKTMKTACFFSLRIVGPVSKFSNFGGCCRQVKDDENWTSIEVKDLGEKGFGIAAWFVNF